MVNFSPTIFKHLQRHSYVNNFTLVTNFLKININLYNAINSYFTVQLLACANQDTRCVIH